MKKVEVCLGKIPFESAKTIAEKITEVLGTNIFAEWNDESAKQFKNDVEIEKWLKEVEKQTKVMVKVSDFFFWARET